MNKPCLIVGCGSHSYSVISIIESINEFEIVGLIDSGLNFDKNEKKANYSVISSLALIEQEIDKYQICSFAIAIGDNLERAKVYSKLKELGFCTPNFISKNAFVDRTVKMGDGNIIAHNVIVNSMAELGSNNLINSASVIEHNAKIGDHNHIGPMSIMCGNTKTHDYCVLGGGANMLPMTSLNSCCTLGAGAVLTKSIDVEDRVLIGIPAQVK